MTKARRKILLIAGIVVIGMLLFPPFQMLNGYNAGYGFIFNPPMRGASVNVALLFAQWIGVLVASGIASLFYKS